MIGVVQGTGSSIPKKILSNDALSRIVETDDLWIRERTGVHRRHIVSDENTVSMAIDAARKALDSGKKDARDIDMIIVATASSNVIMPNTACMVQAAIGASKAICYDLNAACSGFIFAYNTAQAYIAMGVVENVLVIGAETLSKLVDWSDRGTCILFGDGAGAVLLTAVEGECEPMVMHSKGSAGEALICNANEEMNTDNYMQMNGQKVFNFAVKEVPNIIKEVIEKKKIDKNEIDYFVLHQANKRIVELVAKRLDISIDKFPMNLQEYGNTSSASIPILLDELNRLGKLKAGMKLVMAGFGAGLTWGATYLEWK